MATDSPSRLTQLAQLAEVVAAAAVVLSLVYVGREVSANTAAIRAASIQEAASQSSGALRQWATDTTMIRIRLSDPSTLNPIERTQYFLWSRQRWITWQSLYFQNELGVFEPGVWIGYQNIICDAATSDGEVAEWPRHRSSLDPGFVALVESC